MSDIYPDFYGIVKDYDALNNLPKIDGKEIHGDISDNHDYVDTSPMKGSRKLLTSGAAYSALQDAVVKAQSSPKPREYPTLTLEQKLQLQDLIREYSSVRQALFYYTGAVRRESYVTPVCITKTESSTETQLGCVYKFTDPVKEDEQRLDELIFGKEVTDKHGKEYYKYMLNCGVYCQMIWMGRPISDFISDGEGLSLTGKDQNDLLYYVRNKLVAPAHHALQSPPAKISKKINSVFEINNKPWGYYFDFEESKRMYKATNDSGDYYSYNSFFNYKNTPVKIPVTKPTNEKYTISDTTYGKVAAHPLTHQVIVDYRVTLNLKEETAADTEIIIGTLDAKYKPDHTVALAVHHPRVPFAGKISTDGAISVTCDEVLSTGTVQVSVNGTYFLDPDKVQIEPNGTQTPLGFDGAANMAQELYVKGFEVPYSEIDIGDLVFFRSSDISDDCRNNPDADDDDAMSNKLFRYISHVGIVYDFDDKGYPIISDCTNAYSYPTVINRTSLESNTTFARVKASYERNNVVMVARHPAAFGLGGNVPGEFKSYRGTLVKELTPNE